MESRKAKLLAAVVLATTALAFAEGAPRTRITLLSVPAHPQAGRPVAIVVRASRAGKPVRRARVVVTIARKHARRLFAARSEARGRYRARVVFPAAGRWALGARIGGTQVKLGTVAVRPGVKPLKFAWPTSIDFVSSRSLLLVENGAGRLLRVDPNTGKTRVVQSIAHAYAVAHTTSMYLSAGNALLRVDDGRAPVQVADGPEQIGPVATGPNGDVFYATATQVFRLPGGAGSPVPIAGTSAMISGPHGLAVAADGAVLVSDTGNGRLRRIDPATGIITTIATLDEPRGLDVAADGSIYVVDAAAGRVVHLAADGRRLGSFGPVFTDPYDVEAGEGGSLYVIDTSAKGRLYRIARDGTYRIIARRPGSS